MKKSTGRKIFPQADINDAYSFYDNLLKENKARINFSEVKLTKKNMIVKEDLYFLV